MERDVKEPPEELVTDSDLKDQIHQDCCVQDVGEIRAQQREVMEHQSIA